MQNMELILAYIYIRWKKDEKERKKPTEPQDTWDFKVPLVQFCLLKAVSVRVQRPGLCCQIF